MNLKFMFSTNHEARVESADFLELSVKYFVRKFISQIKILSDWSQRDYG